MEERVILNKLFTIDIIPSDDNSGYELIIAPKYGLFSYIIYTVIMKIQKLLRK